MGYRVAVVGATGNVGREMLNILAEREFPVDEIVALASRKSLGTECSFGDRTLKTLDLDGFDFTGWDIALFAIGSDATKKYAPIAAKAGCVVIDNSSLYRYDPEVPLIVPEVNPDAIEGYAQEEHHRQPELLDRADGGRAEAAARPRADQARGRRDLPVGLGLGQGGDGRALEPDQGPLRAGPGGRAERLSQADRLQRHPADRHVHGGRLHPRGMEDGGRDQEDRRPGDQGRRDLRPRPGLRRPLRGGRVEFEDPLDEDEAREILRESPGVLVVDKREAGGYVTPVECVGDYATFVSRIRTDPTVENGLMLWVVSDNLRKGAALNAVQIAELLGRRVLKKGDAPVHA